MTDDTEYIVITDEEGNDLECELLDCISYAGSEFRVLLPVDGDSAEPEAIILRENADGELEGFDDLELLDAVFGLFLEKNGLK
ncbi:MAG: DUF1292 domain-containing protein [Clostridiales bacterium]|nr:DUF1292 domain-containing protein [Clostridiales bacterium]